MKGSRVCPVEHAGSLDKWWRRLLQDPVKILSPYISEGMHVADIGCGPGFFTLPMARMVGETGRVRGYDLQQGMLDIIGEKIFGTELENRISLHLSEGTAINLSAPAGFILAFYVMHETVDPQNILSEICENLEDTGRVLLVEPAFHVSKKTFHHLLDDAVSVGFKVEHQPRILLTRAAVLRHAETRS